MGHSLANLSNRAKWGLLALVFAFTQFIPLIINSGIALAASPITLSKHQGQEMPSGDWGSGNRTEYKEGDTINFRFTANSSEAAIGDISIDFSNEPCHFFAETFSLGSVVPVSGSVPTVTVLSLTSDGVNGDEFHQALKLNFSGVGEAVVYYTLTLSQSAGECTGSSQHSRLSPISDTVQQTGRQNVPIPADKIIELPDITVIKQVDTNGDGQSDRTANTGEWQFSLDGGNPVATDANGKVVFTNVTPDGNHIIVESNGPSDQTFLVGSGTNCTFNSSTATATVAQGTTATDATCIFLNTVKKGSITIIKDADPEGSQQFNYTSTGQSVSNFTLIDDGNAANNTKTFSNLLPGSYSFTETSATNWDLKNIICNGAINSIIDATKPTASITLAAGENITCTFSNAKQGVLTIIKQTIPDGSDESFAFLDSNQNTTNLKDGEQETFSISAGNSFTVDEAGKEGWKLTDITCDNNNVSKNLESGFVTFNPTAGETAECTFTNTKLGSITISKNAVPNSAQDFNFTTTGTGLSDFALDDDNDPTLGNSKTFGNLSPGTYSVTEQAVNGWDFDNISSCSGAGITKNGATVTIVLSAGQNVSCTYTNRQRGHIIVHKITEPADDLTNFSVTASGTSSVPGATPIEGNVTRNDLSTDHDVKYDVAHGTYSVSEDLQSTPGWLIKENTCSELTINGSTPLGTDGVPTVECTITNTKKAILTITKETNPEDSPDSFTFDATGVLTDSFSLTDGQNKTYNFDPSGKLKLTENTTIGDGWDLFSINCGDNKHVSIDITAGFVEFDPDPGETASCTFTNNQAPILTLLKELNDNLYGSGARIGDFTLSAANSTEPSNDFSGTDGVNSKDEIGDTFQAGTYALTETSGFDDPARQYSATWECYLNTILHNTDQDSPSIELGWGDEATCTVMNTFNPAKLTVIKEVINDNGGSAVVGDFDISLTGKGELSFGEGVTVGDTTTYSTAVIDLAKGSYTLSEKDIAGYTEGTWDCGTADNSDDDLVATTLDVVNGQSYTCQIINDDDAPSLTLQKEVVNDNGGDLTADAFTLKASADYFADVQTFTDASTSNTADGTITDKYTVVGAKAGFDNRITISETELEGYKAKKIICSDSVNEPAIFEDVTSLILELQLGQNLNCIFVNDDQPGKVIVYKKVIKDNGGTLAATNFAAKIDKNSLVYNSFSVNNTAKHTDYTGIYTYDNLDSNKPFAVTESTGNSSAYEMTENTCANDFTVANGETKECFITNDDKPGYLIVKKNVINDNGGNAIPSDFDIKYINTSVGAFTEYDRDETQNLIKYKTDPIQLNAFNGYSISELDLPGYQEGNWSCSTITRVTEDDTPRVLGEFDLANGQTVECEITNDDIAPTLRIKKVVTTINETDEDFYFKVDSTANNTEESQNVTVAANSEEIVTDANAGSYTITEDLTNNPNWKFVYVKCVPTENLLEDSTEFRLLNSENGTSDPKISFELGLAEDITCIFSNEELSNVSVLKYNDLNENGIRDEYFNKGLEPVLSGVTFKLKSYLNGGHEYQAVTGENGIATFILVPAGTYEVYEELGEGQQWKTTQFDCTNEYDYTNGITIQSVDGKFIMLEPGGITECTVGNASDNYYYNIAKSNNATSSKRVGDTIVYTITLTIPNDTGVLYNPLVGDAPPTGFSYLNGSWTANSNLRGNLKPGVSVEPTYASPGIWKFDGFDMYYDDGNSVPNNAFYPGEVITLTYQTKIENDVTPGIYPDIALSLAFNTSDEQMQNSDTRVLANVTGQEGDNPFVGTSVEVITDPVEPEQVLVNTGSGAIWSLILGASLIAIGFATRRLSASERGIK